MAFFKSALLRILPGLLLATAFAGLPSSVQADTTFHFTAVTASEQINASSWSAQNLIDGNPATDYSSNGMAGAANDRGVSVAAWFSGPTVISYLNLTARNWNGQLQAFPQAYNIYVTARDNSAWEYVGNFTTQPNQNGLAVVDLKSVYQTYGVIIQPTVLGADSYGNHYFQLAEISAGSTNYPAYFATANDAIPGNWAATNVADGSSLDAYSSSECPSASVCNGAYLAAWVSPTAGVSSTEVAISRVVLTARMFNGQVQAFPANYNLYLTAPDNSSWQYVGNFSNQPDAAGVATIDLGRSYATYGVLIVPTALGTDQYGGHYFQMAEVSLAARPDFSSSVNYLGYFASAADGFGPYTDYTAQYADHGNLTMVDGGPSTSAPEITQKISEAASLGMKSIVSLRFMFDCAGSYCALDGGYQNTWNTIVSAIQAAGSWNVIGFYPLDEPDLVANPALSGQLALVNSMIHSTFPGMVSAVFFSAPEWQAWSPTGTTIPQGYDWVGVDCYGGFPSCGGGYDIPTMYQDLQNRMNPSQKLIAALTAYVDPTYGDDMYQQEINAYDDDFMQYIAGNGRFAALLPYVWQNLGTTTAGASVLNAVLPEMRRIGYNIRNSVR